jgi:phage FluMu protein gp41
VVEDTDWTLERLRQAGFPPPILEALDGVTKREGEAYEDFVKRSAANALSRRVKLADLEDNMDIRRLPKVEERDLARLEKYRRAWESLTSGATAP